MNIANIRQAGNIGGVGSGFYNPLFTHHIGVFGKLPFSEKAFLQPEINYSRKGSKPQDQIGNRFSLNLNYFTIPVLLGFQFDDLSVHFGPQVEFLAEFEALDQVEVSLAGGLQYYLSDQTQVGFRFIHGLSPIGSAFFTDSTGAPSGGVKLYNYLVQLSIYRTLWSK